MSEIPKSHLPMNLYAMPDHAVCTLTRKQLRETLLATDGWVMACGRSYNIRSKNLGAGVYHVSLVDRYADDAD